MRCPYNSRRADTVEDLGQPPIRMVADKGRLREGAPTPAL
jgi:hypothetical protein